MLELNAWQKLGLKVFAKVEQGQEYQSFIKHDGGQCSQLNTLESIPKKLNRRIPWNLGNATICSGGDRGFFGG
jgi:hypothetical protein